MGPVPQSELSALQRRIWDGSLPLEIRIAAADCTSYDRSDPYLIQLPRLSYLPHLLLRLHAFFRPSLINPEVAPHDAWLSFDGLPLKWHYPLGLLYDLFSGAPPAGLDPQSTSTSTLTVTLTDALPLPWRLTLHYTSHPTELLFPLDADFRVLQDAFINAVKESDFIRNGSAKAVMSLSKQDSSSLWKAVETHDLALYNTVYHKLLNPPGQSLRNVPIKIYLPTSAPHPDAPTAIPEEQEGKEEGEVEKIQAGSVRVVQGLVAPTMSKQTTTLGMALNELLPTVFPSRRNPVLAVPVLHGAVVPMNAGLEELGRSAAYADGFLHIVVVLLT
ncbi:Autophagy protein 5-like protein [Elsinoe fawcettii]|nr:Autophagy protein 5-like protein [Elsinoe fawcettii]